MADKKKKSILDSFFNSPGAFSLKEAANFLSQTVNHSDDKLNAQSDNRTDSQTLENQKKAAGVDNQKKLHGQLTEQVTRHITNQITTHKVNDEDEVYFLNENEALLYAALKRNVDCFTTVKRIANVLGKSEHTLRKCLKRLAKMELIKYERGNLRNQQGIRIVDVRDVPVKVLGDRSKIERVLKEASLEEIAFEREVALFKT